MSVTVNKDKVRAEFFESIFGRNEGYICISHAKAQKQDVRDAYFEWPKDVARMMEYIETLAPSNNMWFQAQLLDVPKRKKENVSTCYALWADLDECPPYDITPTPPVILKSSVDRWQACWPLTEGIPAVLAEDFSHRLAYKYRDKGVDQSGWDLTQLLRIPFTYNYKYPGRPIVGVEVDKETKYDPKQFSDLDPVPHYSFDWVEPPQRLLNAETVIDKYRPRMEQYMLDMYFDEPGETLDWSAILWKFMRSLFEIGMGREEVFAVAATAACNKFFRDGRPERLWPDVLRAEARHDDIRPVKPVTDLPEFEVEYRTGNTLIEQYADWGETRSDAPRAYHEAGAFIILSTLMATGLEVETSIDNVKTNMWVLILGDTTLTRKTTAMRQAVKMIEAVDDDAVLATEEGSIEGIISALESRPHRASLFYRDEVAGMFKSMVRKDYLTGMLESFTKLYDGESIKRHLRKEVIKARDPVFIFFGGGIRDATMFAMREEHLTSGFIPRFLWVIGETTPDKIRPLGPRTEESMETENKLLAQFTNIHSHYNRTQTIEIAGEKAEVPLVAIAELTAESWELYNDFDKTHLDWAASQTQRDIIMPVMARTSVNCLKMAALLAGARQEPSIDGRVMVEVTDMAHAIKYVRGWMPHTLAVIRDAGVSANENILQKVLTAAKHNPGIKRSIVMQNHRLTAKEMSSIEETLTDRMQLRVEKHGKARFYYVVD